MTESADYSDEQVEAAVARWWNAGPVRNGEGVHSMHMRVMREILAAASVPAQSVPALTERELTANDFAAAISASVRIPAKRFAELLDEVRADLAAQGVTIDYERFLKRLRGDSAPLVLAPAEPQPDALRERLLALAEDWATRPLDVERFEGNPRGFYNQCAAELRIALAHQDGEDEGNGTGNDRHAREVREQEKAAAQRARAEELRRALRSYSTESKFLDLVDELVRLAGGGE